MKIKFLKRLLSDLKGQTVVLFTLLLPVCIGSIGIAIDTGWFVYNQSKLKNATDLAVFSGAQSLPESKSEARSAAETIFQENFPSPTVTTTVKIKNSSIGIENLCTETSITSADMCNEISVQSSEKIHLFFMQLFGLNSVNITSHALAKVEPLYQPSTVIPIGLKPGVTLLNFGDEVIIWGNDDDKNIITNISGNFGLVDPTNNGSMNNPNDLEYFISNNYQGVNKKGKTTGMPAYGGMIHTIPGNKGNHVPNGFEKRIQNGLTGATIIIVDWENALKGGRTQAPVLGFAYFSNLKVEGGTVIGTYTKYIDVKGKGSSAIPYNGVKVINLLE